MTVTDDDFISLDAGQLTLSRKADGSLPDIDFLRLKSDSKLNNAGLGCFIGKENEDTPTTGWKKPLSMLKEI